MNEEIDIYADVDKVNTQVGVAQIWFLCKNNDLWSVLGIWLVWKNSK